MDRMMKYIESNSLMTWSLRNEIYGRENEEKKKRRIRGFSWYLDRK
jgi:hypothetical protein